MLWVVLVCFDDGLPSHLTCGLVVYAGGMLGITWICFSASFRWWDLFDFAFGVPVLGLFVFGVC